jgi:ATP-dependent DNA helicase DinG
VGRLIRSEDDRGAVIALDTRLINRKYGQVLINSIPIKNVTAASRDNIKKLLGKWL